MFHKIKGSCIFTPAVKLLLVPPGRNVLRVSVGVSSWMRPLTAASSPCQLADFAACSEEAFSHNGVEPHH